MCDKPRQHVRQGRVFRRCYELSSSRAVRTSAPGERTNRKCNWFHLNTQAGKDILTHTHTSQTRTHTHARRHIPMHTQVYTYIHTHTQTHRHTHTHTHTHTIVDCCQSVEAHFFVKEETKRKRNPQTSLTPPPPHPKEITRRCNGRPRRVPAALRGVPRPQHR